MVEVGATNKTHLSDYVRAVTPDTAMVLKVHPSNYRLIGFTESAAISELRSLADDENAAREQAGETSGDKLLVYEDQGSGAFMRLTCFGDYAEPTVSESLQAGADLVSFSGDKLLGGPQAGIIVGAKSLIARLKKNPLARALRLDKMTLAALEATLRLYLNPENARREIPTLRMLTETADEVRVRTKKLASMLKKALPADACEVSIVEEISRAWRRGAAHVRYPHLLRAGQVLARRRALMRSPPRFGATRPRCGTPEERHAALRWAYCARRGRNAGNRARMH